MRTELATLIKILDKFVDLLFKFFDRQRQQEIEDNVDEIHKNPADWFNNRYNRGLRDNSGSDGEPGERSDDPKA